MIINDLIRLLNIYLDLLIEMLFSIINSSILFIICFNKLIQILLIRLNPLYICFLLLFNCSLFI
jgi:hypothetical protein